MTTIAHATLIHSPKTAAMRTSRPTCHPRTHKRERPDLSESSTGLEAKLTPQEFSLLAELAAHPGKVLTHTHLLREVWGPAYTENVEYLRVTVRSAAGLPRWTPRRFATGRKGSTTS